MKTLYNLLFAILVFIVPGASRAQSISTLGADIIIANTRLTAPAVTAPTGSVTIGGNTITNGTGILTFPTAGQVLCYKSGTWNPTFNAFTIVGGSAGSSATFVRIGKLVSVTVQAIGGTSIASTGGTSNITGTPYTVSRTSATLNAASNSTAIGYAPAGYINTTGNAIYTPTWGATATSVVSGNYETDDACS